MHAHEIGVNCDLTFILMDFLEPSLKAWKKEGAKNPCQYTDSLSSEYPALKNKKVVSVACILAFITFFNLSVDFLTYTKLVCL